MEPSYQTRKLIGRVLLVLLLAWVGWAFWVQWHSPLIQTLVTHGQGPVRVAVFTQPAMLLTFTPTTRKTLIKEAPCNPQKKEQCFAGRYDRFFIPQQNERDDFWAQFKENLLSWRFNPLPVFNYLRAYVNARVQKRTDITAGEFILLSLELQHLTVTDFAIEQSLTPKKKGSKTAAQQPDSATPKRGAKHVAQDLKVIISNASGKRGQAESLKKYLREQKAKGLLAVDVYDTGNYPTLEDKSFIIDYSGNLVQVTQISRAIGISEEIRSVQEPADYYDARIVLGKDFQMPL